MGCILIFLEPYDPDSMPVAYAFKVNWVRKNGLHLTEHGVGLERRRAWR